MLNILTYRHLMGAALALTIAALVAIGGLTYRQIGQLVESDRWLVHARDVMAATDVVRGLVRDLETAERSYLVSGDEDDLEDSRHAQSLLDQWLDRLRALTAEDAAQASRVAALGEAVDESRRTMAQVLASRPSAGAASVLASEPYKRERELNRHVYGLADALARAEQDALSVRQADASAQAEAMGRLLLAAFIVAAGAALFAGLCMRTELVRRRRAEESTRAAYLAVEARIGERTRELSEANELLRSREEQFRVMAELSPVYLFTTSPDGGATYVSPGFATLTGLAPERTLGFGWTDALNPEDRESVMTAWREALAREDTFQCECRFRERGGAYRWFKVRVVAVRGDAGAVAKWVGAAADIHEQQEALLARAQALDREQQARADAERANHLKDDFLATVSHELRTPLNAIVGWVHLLRTGVVPSNDTQHAVEAIERNAHVQRRVVDDLLDVSRMAHGGLALDMAPCSLREIAGRAIEETAQAAEAKGITVAFDPDSTDAVVHGDPTRLTQVVANLLSNAVKFTPGQGRVSIGIHRDGRRAIVRISDSGEGIDPAFLPSIFDPFRQGASRSRRAGLGLGLAIVREIVGLHGGEVVAESAGPGRGAAFTVILPADEHGASAETSPALKGIRVLVAEDEEESAVTVASLLAHEGCAVHRVGTARECLDEVRHWHPQVLICDVRLPDADGYSLLQRVRAIDGFAHVPAIAVHGGEYDSTRAEAVGYLTHLHKPLERDALVREMSKASRASHAGH